MYILTNQFYYGAFTLPDTETDPEIQIDTDTEKLTQNLIGICIGVCLCSMNTSAQF